jgi:hypothetical protein
VRAVLRFIDYVTKQDPTGEETWKAVCVSGDEEECKATSPVLGGDEAANDWMAEHTAQTGHKRFKRTFEDYALVEPK